MRIKNMKHRWARILARAGIALGTVTAGALCFLWLWPALGARPSQEQRRAYARRTDNYKDGVFSNSGAHSLMGSYTDPCGDRAGSKGTTPEDALPVETPAFSSEDFTVTWMGHSTVLLQMDGQNILFDPVLTEIASPVSFAGSKRFSPVPIRPEELPELDLVLLSHDHYDHLDMPTIQAIQAKTKRFLVPLGVENHLIRWGVPAERITEMAWWEETAVGGLTIACTPARHFTGRSLNDWYATLWASWVLKTDNFQVFESGDTGYGDHFSEISERYGSFDLALLDCAQYDERWHDVHMFPEESAQAAQDLRAETVLPIHWGAFSLANHAWDDPAERLTQAAEQAGLTVLSPRLGQTVRWENRRDYQNRWWRDYR